MFTKRFIAILFSMVLFIGNVSAFASTSPNSENTEAIIVSERTYYDEDLEAEVREVITYEPVYEVSQHSLIVTSGGNPQYTNVYTRSKCGLAGIYDVEITDIVMAYGSGYEVYR